MKKHIIMAAVFSFVFSMASADPAEDRIFKVLSQPADKVVEAIGPPAAKYQEEGEEYWLYSNVCRGEAGSRKCAEILMRDGVSKQANWHPEEVMKKNVEIAREFAGFKPPAQISEKSFTFADTGVEGKSKAEVAGKLGQPDFKRVFNGREVWEYKKVRLNKDQSATLTLFLEMEGETVVKSVGN